MPDTLGGLVGYAEGTDYDALGRVLHEQIGNSAGLGDITNVYNPHDGTLTSEVVSRETATPATVDNEAYTYDLSGNITSQAGTRLGATASSETQCYAYDPLARLTAAWTATDNCATAPTPSAHSMVGDPLSSTSAYWTTWGFDAIGNRTSQVDHAVAGGSDTTTSYGYGSSQPDTLTSTTASGGSTATTSYGYDAAGNMTSRTAGQGSQALTWDDAGRLTGITGSTSGNSSFIYDADGNLLIEKDPGATTLYLPGEQITLHTASQTTTGIRYFALPGGGTAYRTGAGTSYGYEIGDKQGTNLLTLDYTAQVPTWRQQTPYGAPRGTPVTWIDNRAFLGKPADPATGLDIIGARSYDPATGRFISPDPILDPASPLLLNGYGYTAGNPVTSSDPTGLHVCWGDSGCNPPPPTDPNRCGCGNGTTTGPATSGPSLGGTPQLPKGWTYQKTGLHSGVVTHTWVQRRCSGGARTGMPWCWWQTNHQQFNVWTICTGGARTGLPHCYPASDFLTPDQGTDVFLTIMLTAGSAGLSAILGAADTAVTTRLPQDIAVSPKAPAPLPLWQTISSSPTQNAWLQTRIAYLRQAGAFDFRVNQQQVNFAGIRVGINRPDLQYSLNGVRWYEEFETSSLQDAEAHGPRIMANDPSGMFLPWYVP